MADNILIIDGNLSLRIGTAAALAEALLSYTVFQLPAISSQGEGYASTLQNGRSCRQEDWAKKQISELNRILSRLLR